MSAGLKLTPDQEARFDAELARAARALVTDELPRGILDAGLAPAGIAAGAVRARRAVPAYAGIGAVLVVLFAVAIALVPGGLSPASPTPSVEPSHSPAASGGPVFLKTLDIRGDLMSGKYSCVGSQPVASIQPGPDPIVRLGTVCTSPAQAGPFIAAVIVGEAADGHVVEIHAKANFTGADTPAARDAIATALAKAVVIAVADSKGSQPLGEWVVAQLPLLAPGDANATELIGVSVKIVRDSGGGYEIYAHPA